MILVKNPLLLFILWLVLPFTLMAKEAVTISGFVFDMNSRAVEMAIITDKNTKKTTTTDQQGYYELTLAAKDTVILTYTCLSYAPAVRIIPVEMPQIRVNVYLGINSKSLTEITVSSQQRQANSFNKIDPSRVRLLADPSGGSIEALLVTVAGVSSTNELSSQYSVRGGNYDENLVYVNGTEVYRPLLIRAGQQEGLSFINPELVSEVNFSAGGFDASYGDKMSSVLDVRYKEPDTLETVVSAGMTGGGLYVGQATADKKFTQIHGLRYKSNRFLLGTLQTTGEYNPSFLDYQTFLTWKPDNTTEIRFLGNYASNTFQFIPESRETEFGTYNQKYSLNVYFDGQEADRFETLFGALTFEKKVNNNILADLQIAGFRTKEEETYDITGQYWLNSTPIKNNQADTANTSLIGIGTYHEHARNYLTATVLTLAHHGKFKLADHNIQWGLSYHLENIHDKIREWEIRDSSGYSLPYSNSTIHLIHNTRSETNLETNRLTGYIQDTWRFRKEAGLVVLNGGIRFNYWNFNRETLISPRLSMSFLPVWNSNMTFRLATGVYYQAPFYKEFRDTVTINGVTQIKLNHDIKAQRSIQLISGMDYHFIWVERPFKLTAEAYYKKIDNLIPYTVDNVRIVYEGVNNGKGYTTGLDMKLFGEFVPGTDSWISLSLMKSRETIDGVTIPRPNEQRFIASLFFQDYFPSDPRFTMNVKLIIADGLPFGPPNSKRTEATLRMPAYRRVDIGFAREFSPEYDTFMKQSPLKFIRRCWIGLDCFNPLDIKNVNSYYWVTDIGNTQWAVPNYLTGRLFNLRFTAEF